MIVYCVWRVDHRSARGGMVMIDFEEELKKFYPSLEVEDAEEAIYNQDLTDMADLMIKTIKESKKEE